MYEIHKFHNNITQYTLDRKKQINKQTYASIIQNGYLNSVSNFRNIIVNNTR